ncbi:MarR family transcriptional regulator [Patescibacteria group bacterium]|nr:MarR family transcriptional regulator [Patescibacteria group bacterium]MCL5091294.1 MarR family transcriptional regulator [Patescibacteria group bacterium]
MEKENQLNRQLLDAIFRISRIVRQEMSLSSRVARLSLLQLEILIYLHRVKQAFPQALAEYFHVNKSTASVHLNHLARLHLIKRVRQTRDRRAILVSLSAKGKKLVSEGLRDKNKRTNRLLALIGIREKQLLFKVIVNLLHQLEIQHEKA